MKKVKLEERNKAQP